MPAGAFFTLSSLRGAFVRVAVGWEDSGVQGVGLEEGAGVAPHPLCAKALCGGKGRSYLVLPFWRQAATVATVAADCGGDQDCVFAESRINHKERRSLFVCSPVVIKGERGGRKRREGGRKGGRKGGREGGREGVRE